MEGLVVAPSVAAAAAEEGDKEDEFFPCDLCFTSGPYARSMTFSLVVSFMIGIAVL